MAVSEHACTTQSLVTVSVVSSVHLRLVPDGKNIRPHTHFIA